MSNTAKIYFVFTLSLLFLSSLVALSFKTMSDSYGFAFSTISRNGKEMRWKKMPITYNVCGHTLSDVKTDGDDGYGAPVTLDNVIKQAFASWINVSGTNLSVQFVAGGKCQIAEGNSKENDFIWVKSNWKSLPFRPPSTALAVTITSFYPSKGEMVSASIHFNNENFKWGYINSKEEESGEARVADIASIATHEIGHFLGFDHSSEDPWEENADLRKATMYYASYPGDTSQRSLEKDDLRLVRHVYPATQLSKPKIVAIEPQAALGGYSGDVLEMTIDGSNFQETVHAILSLKDQRDIQGHVYSIKEDQIKVRFNLIGSKLGEYDLVVANSAGDEEKKENIFKVAETKEEVAQFSSASALGAGGCGALTEDQASTWFIFLIFVVILALRFEEFSRKKITIKLNRSVLAPKKKQER